MEEEKLRALVQKMVEKSNRDDKEVTVSICSVNGEEKTTPIVIGEKGRIKSKTSNACQHEFGDDAETLKYIHTHPSPKTKDKKETIIPFGVGFSHPDINHQVYELTSMSNEDKNVLHPSKRQSCVAGLTVNEKEDKYHIELKCVSDSGLANMIKQKYRGDPYKFSMAYKKEQKKPEAFARLSMVDDIATVKKGEYNPQERVKYLRTNVPKSKKQTKKECPLKNMYQFMKTQSFKPSKLFR